MNRFKIELALARAMVGSVVTGAAPLLGARIQTF